MFNKIRKLSEFGDLDWLLQVEKARRAYNLSYNRAIGTSPVSLKYKKMPLLDIDQRLGIQNHEQDVNALRQNRDEKFDEYAKKNIQKGKIEDTRKFFIGDRVLVYRPNAHPKIKSKWEEGYEIVEQLHDDAYMVKKRTKIIQT